MPPATRQLTDRRSPRRLLRSLTLAPLVVVCSLAFSTAPALAVAPETPEVTVETPIHATTATFHGVLNPGTLLEPPQSGTYKFLYKAGETCTGGSVTKPSGLSLGASPEVLPAETVTGLIAHTKYAVCLSVTNLEGETELSAPASFETAIPPETPETKAALPVGVTTATLNGVLNPSNPGNAGSYEFLYKLSPTECEGESTVADATPGLGGKKEAAFAEVSGLQPNAKYTFCLRAHNEAGEPSALSALETFETLPAPPAVSSEAASEVKSTSATLEAQINPNNEKTKYTFEYSTKETAGVLEAPIVKEPGAAELEGYPEKRASVALSGLKAGETYFYRVVAENAQSEIEAKPVVFPVGSVQEFTTVPTPFTDEVKAIAATFAQFHGHLTPLNPNVTTQYHFSYNLGGGGLCTGESSTQPKEAGKGPGTEVTATDGVENLQPNAEYTVCFVTSNAFGSTEGPAVHFTTLAAPLYIVSESASAVSATEATLEAKINPNNENTTYSFEYATNEALTGATIVPGAPPAAELKGFGNQIVIVGLTGLNTGETYYYRVVAENATSKVDGGINHFTALGAPRVTTEEALNMTSFSAELTATVNPAGLPTTYHFLYVAAANYEPGAPNPYAKGTTTPESSVSPDSTIIHPVFFFASGLQAGETYDYTIVATNAQGGPVVGPNQTFTTAPAPPTTPITNPGGAGEVGPPPAPAPAAVFPLLSHASIAELNAREAQEAKKIPNPTTSLTNAQKLTKALKACHKKKRAKRTKCEKQAHSKYGKKKGKK